MIQKPKSTSQYQKEILDALVATGIKQTSPGGKARAFGDIVGDKIGELETRQYVNLLQTLLPYATGTSLDFIGEIFGVARVARQDASSPLTEQNFMFYVRRGSFGTINGGASITIPAGTRVFTDSSSGPIYVVSHDVVLAAGGTTQVFGAESLVTGADGNAPAGVFTRHNFTNYAESRFGTLLVTNQYGLIGGRDEEDDESYRFRINLRLHAQGGATENDLRLAILQVPGIQDIDFDRQVGSFLVYVYGISPLVPVTLMQMVQHQIDDKTAYPLSGLAVAPDLVGISLSTTVRLSPTATAGDRTSILTNAARAAEEYINNLRVGESLIFNEIADRIMNSDQRIVDIGEPNRPLHEVFIWRARLDSSRYSRYLVGNYTPKKGERIVVENRANAINIEVA